jgi:hypothetical protein
MGSARQAGIGFLVRPSSPTEASERRPLRGRITPLTRTIDHDARSPASRCRRLSSTKNVVQLLHRPLPARARHLEGGIRHRRLRVRRARCLSACLTMHGLSLLPSSTLSKSSQGEYAADGSLTSFLRNLQTSITTSLGTAPGIILALFKVYAALVLCRRPSRAPWPNDLFVARQRHAGDASTGALAIGSMPRSPPERSGASPRVTLLMDQACRALLLFRPPSTSAWVAAPTALTISKMRLRTRPSRIL